MNRKRGEAPQDDDIDLFWTRPTSAIEESCVLWYQETVTVHVVDKHPCTLVFELRESSNGIQREVDTTELRLDHIEWTMSSESSRSHNVHLILDLPKGGQLTLYLFKEISMHESSSAHLSRRHRRQGFHEMTKIIAGS